MLTHHHVMILIAGPDPVQSAMGRLQLDLGYVGAYRELTELSGHDKQV